MVITCKRCGHTWIPIVKEPKQCPKCKQYYYNKEREWEKKVEDSDKLNDIVEVEPEKVDVEEVDWY